tara:strand:+ start:85 stop:411 length:327 start_codon:yes stop_codon:yes gene_type:complete
MALPGSYIVNPDGTITWIKKPSASKTTKAKRGKKIAYKSTGDKVYTGEKDFIFNPKTGSVEERKKKTAQKQMDDNLKITASGRPKFASAGGKISKHYKGAGNIITGRD